MSAAQRDELSLSELSKLQRMIASAGATWLTGFLQKGNGIKMLVSLMWQRLLREPCVSLVRPRGAPRRVTETRAW